MSKSGKIRIGVFAAVVAVAALFIGLWLGGVFGLSPVAKSATFDELVGYNVTAGDIEEIAISVGNDSVKGDYTITDGSEISKVVELLTAEKYSVCGDKLYPGSASTGVVLRFGNGKAFAFGTRNIKHGDKYFDNDKLAELDDYLIALGNEKGVLTKM